MKRLPGLAVLALLAACSGPRLGSAPEVRWGRDECRRCGMIVSEERFASGYVGAEGPVVFDDVGELLDEAAGDPAVAPLAWVRDFDGAGWTRAVESVFVEAPGFSTPMGSGTAAFRDRRSAAAFAAARSGRVLDWEQALGLRHDHSEGAR